MQVKTDADKIVASAIGKVGEIATLPEVTVKIIQIVENPKSTARDLHGVIKNDPALSSRLLKVVNSAFYGLPGQIASVDRAIVLLGLSAVKNIAIAASMTHVFNSGGAIEGFSGVELWRHSVAVAVASRLITAAQGRPSVEESFLAGLIHDLGLLVERQVFPKEIAQIIARQRTAPGSFCDLETETIGADHQAFGKALAAKWRFPTTLCTSIGYHHKPMDLAEVNRELSALVHIADILACKADIGFVATASHEEYGEEILDVVKLTQADLDDIIEKLPEQVTLTESIFAD
ncbi:MAG: HDOD domain-containing protein [Phycisphaerae bacterium]|nr:HDOD domain-containing protein [Phycisphaerae bacterium]